MGKSKNNFEKIGEFIYWAFNESDDKVIEHSSNIKIEKKKPTAQKELTLGPIAVNLAQLPSLLQTR